MRNLEFMLVAVTIVVAASYNTGCNAVIGDAADAGDGAVSDAGNNGNTDDAGTSSNSSTGDASADASPTCTGITCGLNEVCQAGSCICAPDHERIGDACVAPDLCADVTCGNAEQCEAGMCVCNPGFERIDDTCVPDEACNDVTCDTNAVCDEGACICEPGFESIDGACVPEDLCREVTCGVNEACDDGVCACADGFERIDGTCRSTDPCQGVTCNANEVCDEGACICERGFERVDGVCAPEDACQGVTCGANELCDGGACVCADGFEPVDGTCLPEDPCRGVTCGANATCEDGQCACEPGFELFNGQCVPEDPCRDVMCGRGEACTEGACMCLDGYERIDGVCEQLDLALRTADMVCSRWLADWPTQADQVWIPGEGDCSAGTIDMTAHTDAMRRLNLYRWLVGLEPASISWENQAKAQEAAMMMDVNNDLDHSPPESWVCYNSDGAEAAGRSNLALGYTTPASTVDGYIRDRGTPSLGHRRWIFFPRLSDTAFGHVDRGGAMWALSRDNSIPNPSFVAYPAPGAFPLEAIRGVWSFSTGNLGSNITVTITADSDGSNIPVSVSRLQNGFGQDTISFDPAAAADIVAGETYHVRVVDGDRSWEYSTTLAACE
ncbi:MAG: CAP domain-containing protein [Myxococcota bacterium]